jgi:penicillin-binding protein 1A
MTPRHRNLPPGRRARQRRRRRRHGRRTLGLVAVGLLVAIAAGLAAAALTAQAAFTASCSLDTLRPVKIGENSFVYAADGSLLGAIPAERNRQPIALSRVSPWVSQATVAIEDRRFWKHGGVDYEAVARALWRDLQAGRVVEGGSTITQQLVRNLYISREKTFARKIKEACLAIKLSKSWSKQRILTQYLNQVYFGNHAYGIEAAAETYFSRRAQALTLSQAALLAGLPQAPSVYDPFQRPEDALARRDEVLRAMLETREITPARFRSALADRDLHLRPGKLYTRIREPYFFSYVRDELLRTYGANTVEAGGLRVYTTIDPRFQRLARQAIRDTLYLRDDPAAALVAINPANGAIRAMQAVTPGRRGNQFNLAAQARRQAGSTFKTFVLTAAVARGMNPAVEGYVSAPFSYQPSPQAEPWTVKTYDGTYNGWTTVERATLRSDNTVYAQLGLDVGAPEIAAMAHRLGVETRFNVVPSIALGSASVSPLEMASAYATIAAGGIYSQPMAIRKVVLANGKEDSEAGWGKPVRKRVIADWVAAEVTRILAENVQYGTGVAAGIGRPEAGKTGTTENHADAWFCGFVPNLQATVWVGYPKAEIPMESVHGIAVAGGTFPAQIWHRFMGQALRYSPPQDFVRAKGAPEWHTWEKGSYVIARPAETTSSAPAAPAPSPEQQQQGAAQQLGQAALQGFKNQSR